MQKIQLEFYLKYFLGNGEEKGMEGFFKGAYAYHWHNLWKEKVERWSWMGTMDATFDDYLLGNVGNRYCEKIPL